MDECDSSGTHFVQSMTGKALYKHLCCAVILLKRMVQINNSKQDSNMQFISTMGE